MTSRAGEPHKDRGGPLTLSVCSTSKSCTTMDAQYATIKFYALFGELPNGYPERKGSERGKNLPPKLPPPAGLIAHTVP